LIPAALELYPQDSLSEPMAAVLGHPAFERAALEYLESVIL
jgi:hypothetical protein